MLKQTAGQGAAEACSWQCVVSATAVKTRKSENIYGRMRRIDLTLATTGLYYHNTGYN